MYHSFLIHSSADGHLGWFHVLAIINSAAMNIGYTCLFQFWFPQCVCPAVGLLGHKVTITLYTRQQKRHWCIEQSFGLCVRGRGWDDLGEWHWNMYNIIYETSRQSRFDARYWMLGAAALGWPREMVWGGRREEGSGWGTHVYLWRIHVDVWQNQYNIVKLKNKIKKKTKYNRKFLKPKWEKLHLTNRGKPIQGNSGFSSETMEGRRKWQHFQVLKEKNWQFKILYSAKISSRNEEEIKTVLDEDKLRECYASGKERLQKLL